MILGMNLGIPLKEIRGDGILFGVIPFLSIPDRKGFSVHGQRFLLAGVCSFPFPH